MRPLRCDSTNIVQLNTSAHKKGAKIHALPSYRDTTSKLLFSMTQAVKAHRCAGKLFDFLETG
jgi:hypothetical protein